MRMQFHRSGDRYIAIAIGRGHHNFLGLRFGPAPTLYAWSPIRDSGERLRVNAGDVKSQVVAGVGEANAATGGDARVSHIQYLESDSPTTTRYREMARRITLRYLADPESFDGVEDEP